MQLPLIKNDDQVMQLLQTRWSSILNPVLAEPVLNNLELKQVTLATGVNVINHLLSRTQQGWIVTDITSNVTLFRSQPFNDKTLTLTSSGPAVINLLVY